MMAADKMIEGNNFIKKIINELIKKRAKKMCLKANGVSYVTDYILQNEYPCVAIKKGESFKYFTANYSSIDLDEEDFFDQKWKIDEKPKIYKIVHTGFMDSYRKGQHILLKAIKEVKDRGYNVNVLLIGDGKKRDEFEFLTKKLKLENIVEFKGLIRDKKQILQNLRNSHLLVFPTQSEGLPRTIIEAMSQGLPCISSPVDGIPELIDNEFLINYNDYLSYANKIIYLMKNWEKMIEVSKKNFEKSKKYEHKILDEKRKKFYSTLYILARRIKYED